MLFPPSNDFSSAYGCPKVSLATIGWKSLTWREYLFKNPSNVQSITYKHDSSLGSSRSPKFLTFSRCTRSCSHIMGRWLRNHILLLYLASLALENVMQSQFSSTVSLLACESSGFFGVRQRHWLKMNVNVTDWCRGCPPSSCRRSGQCCWWCSERKDVSGPQPEWDASSARTPAWPRSDRTAGDGLQLQTEDISVKVCSFLWRIFLLKSSRPSPDVHDKSISVS